MVNICPICGGKLGLLNREKSVDGLICASCSNFFFSKLGWKKELFSCKMSVRRNLIFTLQKITVGIFRTI